MSTHLLRLHHMDNVAVAAARLPAGTELEIDGEFLAVLEDIPAGHKIALTDLSTDALVVKYGHTIGTVTCPVGRGRWLHSHNVQTALGGFVEYRYQPTNAPVRVTGGGGTFDGYRRANGAVGTRNEIWILTTVGCVNRSAERIARICREQCCDGIDGIHAFTHPYGCSQSGDDLENTRCLLAGLMNHPNAGGVLLLGLGCEDNHLESLLQVAGTIDRERLRYLNSQDASDELEYGAALVRELAGLMQRDRRTEHSVNELVVGLECGGSDAFSGITANPLAGRITDRITTLGGTAILTEVPEMFGAEHTLMNRAVSEPVFRDIERLVNDFKRYYLAHDRPIYENPTPGNLEGGLTTLEEKSLGAIKKGGTATVTHVLRYGERSRTPGLGLLEAPGNDAVSATALVAAGATVILFTTGRGTPMGSPVPTIKISSNTSLYETKRDWIDFNAGALQDGSVTVEDLEADLFDLVLEVASGRKRTSNERNDYRDIAIWKSGVTL